MRKKINYMISNWRKAKTVYLHAAIYSLVLAILMSSCAIWLEMLQHGTTYKDMANFISWEGKLFYPSSVEELTTMYCEAKDCSDLEDKYRDWKTLNVNIESTYVSNKIESASDAYYIINDLYRLHVNDNGNSSLQRFIIENLYNDLKQCVYSSSSKKTQEIQDMLNSEYTRILSDINYRDSKFPKVYVYSKISTVCGTIMLICSVLCFGSWNALRLSARQVENTLESCPIRKSVKKEN